MIVDARAIGIEQAKKLLTGEPIPFIPEAVSGEQRIQPHDRIVLVSICDSTMEKPFRDSADICAVEFADIEPMNIDFQVPPGTEYMTEAHAQKVFDFIKKWHSAPEKVLFLAHCRHGMCRSGAVVDFVGMFAGLGYWNTRRRNPQIVPNHWVQFQLNQVLFRERLA